MNTRNNERLKAVARKTKEQQTREAVANDILAWCEDVQKHNGETPLGLCGNCRPYAIIALEGYDHDRFFKQEEQEQQA